MRDRIAKYASDAQPYRLVGDKDVVCLHKQEKTGKSPAEMAAAQSKTDAERKFSTCSCKPFGMVGRGQTAREPGKVP